MYCLLYIASCWDCSQNKMIHSRTLELGAYVLANTVPRSMEIAAVSSFKSNTNTSECEESRSITVLHFRFVLAIAQKHYRRGTTGLNATRIVYALVTNNFECHFLQWQHGIANSLAQWKQGSGITLSTLLSPHSFAGVEPLQAICDTMQYQQYNLCGQWAICFTPTT